MNGKCLHRRPQRCQIVGRCSTTFAVAAGRSRSRKKSRAGIHDDAHDAFMTLVSHTTNKEAGEHLTRSSGRRKRVPPAHVSHSPAFQATLHNAFMTLPP